MATKYVSTTGTDDGAAGRGDTPGDAYATLQFAVDNVGNDTIEIVAGTYAEDQTIFGNASQTVTIQPYQSGAVNFNFVSTGFGLYVTADNVTATVNDIVFGKTGVAYGGGSSVVRINTDVSASLTIDGCTFDTGAFTPVYFLWTRTDVGVSTNAVTFTNCTIDVNASSFLMELEALASFTSTGTSYSGTGHIHVMRAKATVESTATISITGGSVDNTTSSFGFEIVGGASFTMDGVTLDGSNFSDSLIDIDGTPTTIDISANVITAGNITVIELVGLTSVTNLIIDGNNITGGASVLLGDAYSVTYGSVSNNTITSANAGTKISIGDNDEDVATKMNGIIVDNNAITNTAANGAHCIMLGHNTRGCVVTNNTCTMTSTTDFNVVVKGKYNLIEGNVAVGPETLYLAGGQYNTIRNNTFYSTGKSALGSATDGAPTDDRDPIGNVIVNNIFDGSGTILAVDMGSGAEAFKDNRFDYNCYKAGSSGAFQVNGVIYDTIAALTAAWPSLSTVFANNDINSQMADPQFVNPPSDLNLKPTSPLLNTGDQGSIGGWQPFALPQQEYRSRYAGPPLYR